MPDGSNETKAQRVERLKREKNPWECFGEIERFAREGYSSIPPEWLSTYFRWWGVYTQGDGVGALGGTGGEGKATPYFMVRIRIPTVFFTPASCVGLQTWRKNTRGALPTSASVRTFSSTG